MIKQVLGIDKIRMLYLQLLYRCNFDCIHCYHGERLKWRDAYTLDQAIQLLDLLANEYQLKELTLLGGEPFVYKDVTEVLRHAKEDLGLRIDICTNAYKIERQLRLSADHIDLLRVSLDGMAENNDRLRNKDSFEWAMRSLDLARDLGIPTSGTMTVNSLNVGDVIPLARALAEKGSVKLNLHGIRVVGNAVDHPELALNDQSYAQLNEALDNAGDLGISLRLDPDLLNPTTEGDKEAEVPVENEELDRIEADPRGALSFSCFAVGNDRNAFWFSKETGGIDYRPTGQDEVSRYLSLTVK